MLRAMLLFAFSVLLLCIAGNAWQAKLLRI
jgi:hypothetical protein